MALKIFQDTNRHLKRLLYIADRRIEISRNKKKNVRSPEEIAASLPLFQYADEKTRQKTKVFIWGSSIYGALGIRNYFLTETVRRKQKRPARLPLVDDYDITDVSCGYGFTIFAVRAKGSNKNHAVFGTGLNSDSQIGYHTNSRRKPLEILITPVQIRLPSEFTDSTKVKQVACGRAHTFILTETNKIFSLGNNAYGQCGRAIVENEEFKNNPTVNTVRFDGEVEEIVCGQDNTIFRTKQGEIYTFGWGADGQLGTGSYKNEWIPTKVSGDIAGVKIKHISCAADCVLAVSENGELFGWGNNEYCQIVDESDVQQVVVPRHISTSKCGKIAQAAAAGTMCGIVNTEGQVYVWGYGLLGMGPAVKFQRTFTPLPMPLFGRNELNQKSYVTTLRSGISQFAAITNDGDLYMWGRNHQGCLGLGMAGPQYFPFKVSLSGKAADVSCGVDHTAVICKTLM